MKTFALRLGLLLVLLTGWMPTAQAQSGYIDEVQVLRAHSGHLGSDLVLGQYELLELGIALNDSLQNIVLQFLQADAQVNPATGQPLYDYGAAPGLNPYDPRQVDLLADFISQSGDTVLGLGFYYQDHERRADTLGWTSLQTPLPWRIRFSTRELGPWTCRLRLRVAGGPWVYGPDFSFEVKSFQDENKGFVEVGPSGRYLQLSRTGELFRAYGPNLTRDARFPNGMHVGPAYDNYYYLSERMDSLAANGAQLVRIRIAPIAYGIEWERAGNYHFRQNLCWDLDQIVELAAEKGIYLMLSGLFERMECHAARVDWTAGKRHHPYSWYEDSLLWADESVQMPGSYADRPYYGNPYNKFVLKQSEAGYDMDAYWRDPEVKALARNKVRYTAARWGWATSVAEFAVASEFQYFEVENGRDDAGTLYLQREYPFWRDWILDLSGYFQELAPNHLVGNHLLGDHLQYRGSDGEWKYLPMPDDFFKSDSTPLVHVNSYGHWPDRNFRFTDHIRKQRRHRKPIWWAETGLSVPCEGIGRLCILEDKMSFHHNLWAMGLSGALPGSHFWGERIYAFGLFRQYLAVNRFLSGEDLHRRDYIPMVQYAHPYWVDFHLQEDDVRYGVVNDSDIDFFGLRSTDQKRILGYVHNATVNWYNFPAPESDLKYPRTGDYAHFDYDAPVPPANFGPAYRPVERVELQLSQLLPRSRYQLERWSTTGEGGPVDSVVVETDRKGNIVLNLSPLEGNLAAGQPFVPGAWAFKLSLLSGEVADLVQGLEVWPSPASEELEIAAFFTTLSKGEALVFDAAGRLVWQGSWDYGEQSVRWRVDVSGWSPGLYVVRLEAGSDASSRRFVVQH